MAEWEFKSCDTLCACQNYMKILRSLVFLIKSAFLKGDKVTKRSVNIFDTCTTDIGNTSGYVVSAIAKWLVKPFFFSKIVGRLDLKSLRMLEWEADALFLFVCKLCTLTTLWNRIHFFLTKIFFIGSVCFCEK